ncbi:homeobox protein BEL1 homolog isoform X1 [Rosa rugosa]|uniref:homeobox protein BEL1 homolog isoform X1 n=1 Tax=Rosa rugosa TaxID=74645 RepID=UPI002B40D6E7|nr:homeobox protein BEL1 homolog isoform X1 [Rosa rugosa]XP_062026157.1 homeobox protein BEL1 homolog isoform X1 [Rosa rugosa]
MARELCSEDHKSSSVGFCYSDVSSANPTIHHQNQFTNQIQGFDQSNPAEIFNLTTGMEMIGFSKGAFFSKHGGGGGPSSSKGADHFYHPHQQEYNTTGMSETSSENQNLMESGGAWHQENSNNRFLVDDSSLRCVFPCEGNERPSQGLSLSLSSSNPSSIGLQSFELRQTNHHQDIGGINQSHMILQDGYLGKSSGLGHQSLLHENQAAASGLFQLRNSKYLGPAQELLNEFCSLGTKQTDALGVSKHKSNKTKQWEDQDNNNGSTSSSSKKQSSLYSLEFVELQKRKTRLLQMLEEVERRYKHYCDQMKAVVSSFETVAGTGAATVYSKLASKAMSRHFRSLKDGIVAQIQATRKAMGEKDPVAPGASRGETPRLRILDQTLRQQRAFQQMNMMESHPWRPQRGLPERSVSVLRAWLFEHFLHPYPSDVDKHILARQTGLSRSQVSNWFINARVRLWKPMVEEMYMEETKEHENNNNMSSSDGVTTDHHGDPSTQMTRPEDQKPTQDQLQLVRIDSECLSSIITNNPGEKSTGHDSRSGKSALQMHPQHNFGRVTDAFGSSMELDFSTYNHHHQSGGAVAYGNENPNQSFNGGGHGVSLTLGLNQHGGTNGVSLAFSPSSQSSLFYPRDHIEECQPVQYSSLLDGEGQNNLPYRNLMGAQLLHDLAG